MKYLATLFSIGLLLGGCGADETIKGSDSAPTLMEQSGALNESAAERYNFGDVEANLQLEVIIAEKDVPAGGAVTELRAANKEKLNIMTLDIEGAAPTALPITMLIKAKKSFADNFVAVRGKLLREITTGEREEIFTFNTLVDERFYRDLKKDPAEGPFPALFSTDALNGLETMPPTMLLYVEAEAVLVDMATDKLSIDLATVTSSETETGTLLSNPIRINYTMPPVEEASSKGTEESTENTPGAESVEEAPAAQ